MHFALISAIAALGGLLFGYDAGVISSALLFIRKVFHLSAGGQSIVAAVVLAGAVIGACVAGSLSDHFGRRRVILVTALVFVLGALISAAAGIVDVLIVGRLLVGIAIGVASMLTPLYLAEISPAASRGAVTSLNQLCIAVGILVSYLVGYAFASTVGGWRWMLGLGAVPGAVLAAGMLARPESPRWLAGHSRLRQAEAVLRRLRGPGADVAGELADLHTDLRREGGRLAPWSALLAPNLELVGLCGRAGTFLIYTVLTLIAIAFTAILVPETKGRSLEEIEEALKGGAPRVPAVVRTG